MEEHTVGEQRAGEESEYSANEVPRKEKMVECKKCKGLKDWSLLNPYF
jgi:hypothetical protein